MRKKEENKKKYGDGIPAPSWVGSINLVVLNDEL